MLITLAIAVAGGLILMKIKVPGGMLVGAILSVVALNIATGEAYIYPQARVLAQALTGAYIGCMITRDDVKRMPMIIKPYLVSMTSLLILNLCVASFFYRFTDFDLITCLFCTAPGGMTDMPLIAMDMGADASAVALMQFVRMVFGIGVLPTVVLLSDRLIEPEVAREMEQRAADHQKHTTVKQKPTLRAFLPTFCVALLAALLGRKLGIPAGAMSFSLVATAALKLSGKCHGMPPWLRRVAQVVSGCCIGYSVDQEQLLSMGQLVIPAMVLCLGYAVCCVCAGLLSSKLCKLDLREAMLTLSPAGATEMALIAADLGVESPNLVVLQICRLVGVLMIFPHIFTVIVSIMT